MSVRSGDETGVGVVPGVQRVAGVPPRGPAVFDMATGVLLAVTRQDPFTATADLIAAARSGRVDVFHLAAALVELAGGLMSGADPAAIDVALDHWGPQLAQLPGRGVGLHPTAGTHD